MMKLNEKKAAATTTMTTTRVKKQQQNNEKNNKTNKTKHIEDDDCNGRGDTVANQAFSTREFTWVARVC